MSISVSNAKMSHGEEGNEVSITLTVTLTEEEASDYIELDELLRANLPNNRELSDTMSDCGWSYCEDVLTTLTWISIEDMLLVSKEVIYQQFLKQV